MTSNEKQCGLSDAGIPHKPHAWIVQRVGFGCPGIDPNRRRDVHVVTFVPHGADGGVGGFEWNYDKDAIDKFWDKLVADLDACEGETLMQRYETTVPMLNLQDVTDYIEDGFMINDPIDAPVATYITGRTGATYEQQQIDRVLDEAHAIDQMHKVKVASGSTSTETKWLNLTTAQLQQFRALWDDNDTPIPSPGEEDTYNNTDDEINDGGADFWVTHNLLRAAYGLLGDGLGSHWDENPEYTRGIAQLIANAVPFPYDGDADGRQDEALRLVRLAGAMGDPGLT